MLIVLEILVADNVYSQTTFGPQQVIVQSETASATSVYAADLDGDGDLDILSASELDDKIAWYENNGAGNFGAQQIITTAANGAWSVYAADIDGDGDLDVLSASFNDDKIAWYENDGAGNFGAQQIITTTAGGARSVYAADIDGDGDLDVLSASSNDDKIAWYANDGAGNFGAQQIITTAADYAKSVYAADIDGDGDMDVLSASTDDDKIAWYENDGVGNFGAQQIISTATNGAWSVYAADLDGDGDMDVLSTSFSDNNIAWYENDGIGNFGDQQIITTAAGATSVYASDLDGDGDMDVLSASWIDDKIAWYENDGLGNFGAQQIITTTATGARSVYAADLDDDGDLDVLSASFLDDKMALYENDGSGNFGIQHIITAAAAASAWSVYAADLDADGDMDVLSASQYDDKIACYKNDGTGNFGAQQIITTAANIARFVYAADLDGDGDMDVLSASWLDDKIAWYENDGLGNFSVQQIITTVANGAQSVYVSDLDGDGDLDVLSASSDDDKIAWYENDGAGNFGAQQIISFATDYATSVYASDLDGDGDMDVLSASGNDNNIAWYENDGIGNFGAQQIISFATDYATSVYASDLDGDGDLDVLSASLGDDKIAWYENLILSETDPLPPVAALTTLPAAATDTLIVCQGQSVQFLNQSENANAFLWEFGNGTTSTTANPSYTYPESGTYEVTLTAYSNFPQPDVCEADAGEWVLDFQGSFPYLDIVSYNDNSNYSHLVIFRNINPSLLWQSEVFTTPLSQSDQLNMGERFLWGNNYGQMELFAISYRNDMPFEIPSIEQLSDQTISIYDLFPTSIYCIDIEQLSGCTFLHLEAELVYNESTESYNIQFDANSVCLDGVLFQVEVIDISIDNSYYQSYEFWDFECCCVSETLNIEDYQGELYISVNNDVWSCAQSLFIPPTPPGLPPDTSPRPAQKDGESIASMVIVVEPGFAPQISCVATVCLGMIAEYSTNADCETYLWEVSGGQILSGQGTPAISVEWTTPPLGSISLSAGCGEETCNQPTVAAVPVIGGTVTIEGQSNFCLNETLQYTAPYFGGTAYQWSIVPSSAGTILSGQGGNLITVQWGASAATLQLNYQNNLLNCGGTASLAAQPKPAFAINPTSLICEGNSMSISANSMASFVWSVSGGEIISGQNSSQILLLCSASGSMTVSAFAMPLPKPPLP